MPPDNEMGPPRQAEASDAEIRRRGRRGFISALFATAGGFGLWHWLHTRRMDEQIPWPLRRALELDESVARDFADPSHHAAQLPDGSAPPKPRLNGDIGLGNNFDPTKWRLNVSGLSTGNGSASLTLDDLKQLPLTRMTNRLCCIEGWDIWVNWGGVRFTDFLHRYPPNTPSGQRADPIGRPTDFYDYVAMNTPDNDYFVGLDIGSVIHPQTMLAYEIDGQPLTAAHGAPLRLVIPSKYGVKNIKRIGSIRYTGVRPADYWAQRGYDWYCGL
jgi:DMSO/TMAO reductase YedYZ molybdopterin-dependent catalytic subunit